MLIHSRILREKREQIIKATTVVPSLESFDSVEARQRVEGNNAFMENMSESVRAKFAQYRVESEEQRQKTFPHKDSPFKK